ERRATVGRQAVVLAASAGVRGTPLADHVALAFEAVQQWVQEALGPGELAVGEFGHALDDRVAVTVLLRENAQHQWRCARGDQVFGNLHVPPPSGGAGSARGRIPRGSMHSSSRYVNAALLARRSR